MHSRRSILRAFGIGAPAAAVAATLGMVKSAQATPMTDAAAWVNVSTLSAIGGNLGEVTAGRILHAEGRMEIDLDRGVMTISCDDGGGADNLTQDEIEAFYRHDDDLGGDGEGWDTGGDRDDGV